MPEENLSLRGTSRTRPISKNVQQNFPLGIFGVSRSRASSIKSRFSRCHGNAFLNIKIKFSQTEKKKRLFFNTTFLPTRYNIKENMSLGCFLKRV